MKELVSVVIPVYNAEKYIADCLESLINQSYTNIEIIVINDGSSDSSGKICKDYAARFENKIHYIEKKNEGLSVARRVGIAEVKGKYFCTIDADDLLDSDYVKALYSSVCKNKADIALCGRIAFDKKNSVDMPINDKLPDVKKISVRSLEDYFWNIAMDYQMSDSWNKMYRTDFVKKSGVVHELNRKYNGTDLLYNYLLLLHKPVISTVHRLLYKYRIVEGSVVHRKEKFLQEGFEVIIKRLLQECYRENYSEKITNQILLSYYGMLKYVTTDIVEYYKGSERDIRIKDCIKEHRKFVEILGRDVKFKGLHVKIKPSLRLFFSFLKMGNYWGIILYYRVRDVTNMIAKRYEI